jgi:hypothetical protein
MAAGAGNALAALLSSLASREPCPLLHGTNIISGVISETVTAVGMSVGSLHDTCPISQADWKFG